MNNKTTKFILITLGVLIIMSIVIIASKHIYGEPQYNTSNNIINGVNGSEQDFGDKIKVFELNVVFDYSTDNEFDKSLFEQNTDFQNITYTSEPLGELDDIMLYMVNFDTIIRLDNDFLLENLTVNTSNYVKYPQAQEPITDRYQIYNPEYSGDFKFDIVKSIDEFNLLQRGNWGKCGLQRIDSKTFKAYCQIVYQARRGDGSIETQSYNRSINLFANAMVNNVASFGDSKYNISIESNEIMSTNTKIDNTKICEHISNNIIQNYQKGKKRISLKVGYGDYYYQDGTPYGGVAGAKKLLQVGDIVEPMQWKNGVDVPFAIKNDGSPVIFEITSAELDASGAPKLTLELLEKTS